MALIAHFKLDGNFNETSGSGVVATQTASPTWTDGKISNAMARGAFSLPAGILNEVVQSIAFWYYNPATTTGSHQIIGGNPRNYALFAYPNSVDLHWSFYDDSTSSNRFYGFINNILPDNKWTHIALVNDFGALRIYINGNLERTQDISGWVRNFNSGPFQAVHDSAHHRINDYRIYNHALSEVEIKELVKAKVVHYTFNDYAESTLNFIGNQGKGTGESRTGWNPNQNTTLSNAVNKNGKMGIKCVSNQSSSTPGMYIDLNLTSGRTYTVSAEVQSDCTTFFGYLTTATYTPSARYDFPTRVSVTFTASAASVRLYFFISNTRVGEHFIAADIQVEEKPYATEFVHNTRNDILYDASGNGNHIPLDRATCPRWTENSMIGSGAYHFDGVNNYITAPAISGLDGHEEMTISFWFKPEAMGSGPWGTILLKGPASGSTTSSSWSLSWREDNPNITLTFQSNVYILDIPATMNQEMFLVYTRTNAIARVYLNGVQVTTHSSPPICERNDANLLRIMGAESNAGRRTKGVIDDIRVYASALSAEDVMELYKVRKEVDSLGNVSVNHFKEIPRLPKVNVTSGLVAHYPLDGTVIDVIKGGSGYVENVIPASGLGGKSSMSFNGVNSGIQITDTMPTVRTICMWVHTSARPTGNEVVFVDGRTEVGIGFYNNGYLILYSGTGTIKRVAVIPSSFNNSGWNHLAVTYNSSMTPTCYVNGVVVSSYSGDNYWTENTSNIYIGKRSTGTNFRGKIQDLRMYSSTLSAANVVNVMNEVYLPPVLPEPSSLSHKGVLTSPSFSQAVVPERLIAWYPLNGVVRDYAGNSHGTINGAIVTQGVANKAAYQFNGGQYISFPTTIPTGGDFSVAFWAYTSDNQNQCFICTRTAVGNGFSIFILNSRNIRIDTEADYQWLAGYTIPLDTWAHITVVKEVTRKELYVNGEFFASTTAVPSGNLNVGDIQTIGVSQVNGGSFGNYLKGRMQGLRIYDRGLSAGEIQTIYNAERAISANSYEITKDNIYTPGEFKIL